MHSNRLLSYSEKTKFNRNDQALSFVTTCCHLLPIVAPLWTTGCQLLYQSLSLDVSLVCLFIKCRNASGKSGKPPLLRQLLIRIVSSNKYALMLFFSILSGISPFLEAFLEDKLKISFLTSSSLTLLNNKLDLEWKFVNLIFWTLPWFCKVFIIFSRFTLGSVFMGLSFRWVVMVVK